jgi:hypothetical protein
LNHQLQDYANVKATAYDFQGHQIPQLKCKENTGTILKLDLPFRGQAMRLRVQHQTNPARKKNEA